MKYIPLANLKNTTGIVALCKEANEIVVANRNGQPKLVLMSREVYENGLGKLTDRVLLNVRRDMELVAEPVLIRTFNNPAEIVRICESEMGKCNLRSPTATGAVVNSHSAVRQRPA